MEALRHVRLERTTGASECPTHTWSRRTKWNQYCRKTTHIRDQTWQWTVCKDIASLTEWKTLDPSKVQKALTVMVPTKMYVNGDAYFSMTALPAVDRANLSTMTRKERVEPLWSGMRGQRPPPPVGCRTFLMVSFSSMVFLENLAHDKGAQEASRTSRPMRQEARTETSSKIRMEKDAPWTVIYRFPSCVRHPWSTGRREGRCEQREDMVKQFLWMVSSDQRRISKRCLASRMMSPINRSNFGEERHHSWTRFGAPLQHE